MFKGSSCFAACDLVAALSCRVRIYLIAFHGAFVRELTSVSCVYNEVTHFKGSSFYQATSKNSGPSGVPDLRLDHHDRYRAVWYMAPVFHDANQMFSYFPWNE